VAAESIAVFIHRAEPHRREHAYVAANGIGLAVAVSALRQPRRVRRRNGSLEAFAPLDAALLVAARRVLPRGWLASAHTWLPARHLAAKNLGYRRRNLLPLSTPRIGPALAQRQLTFKATQQKKINYDTKC